MKAAWANETSSSSSFSSSSISTQFKYDVFLSFSGVDTRNNFTSHLLPALERHGFHTFRDDTKLNRGEYIGDELLKAIEGSRISLVVLSKNYAASRWCLDELVKIMECKKTLQQIVLPIFYNVEPSDVRAQRGSLAEAFAKHEERLRDCSDGRVKKWREALTDVANLSGWDLPKVANGDDAGLIHKVIEEVQNKLNLVHLHVACHEIGLESRIQKLKVLLKMESADVRIVAVRGMGGIGKTTIVKKLYNLIQHKFEGSCFLTNIRETSKQPKGPVDLQERLLSDILGTRTHNLRNFHHGIEVIKRRAFGRKVLLILDDVDDVQQLIALAIDRDFFGFGSRIIITTRDISTLNLVKVDEIYTAEELNKDESLELFRWHCFKEDHPTEDHLDLSGQVVHYAGGLPLALENLGPFFCRKSIPEWKSAIAKLRKYGGNRLVMHDMVREMGREIMRQESLDYPGKRSRLWDLEDDLQGLRYGKVRVVCSEFLNNCPLRNQHQHEEDMINPPPYLTQDMALLQQPSTPAALPISRTKPYAGISRSGESDMVSRTGSPLQKQENPNYHCGLGCSLATGTDDPPPYLIRDLALLQQPLTTAAPPISRTKPYAGIPQWRTGSPLLRQENPNDHFVLGCSVATGSDDFQAVGTGSDSTVECQMAGRNFDTLPPSNQVMASIDTDIVTVKAKYQTYTIKFQLSRPWGMAKLEEQVKKRLKELDAGTYLIKYKDEEGEMILIACDEDLQFYIERSRLKDPTTSIVVFLERK